MIHELTTRILISLIPSTRLGAVTLLLGLWLVVGIAGCAVVGIVPA